MPVTNNVTRMLDAKKIAYTAFELPAEKLGARETARRLGIPLAIVFKTIVALRGQPGTKPILALIPGGSKLDLKALAAAANEKKIQLSTQREAENLTGLQAGGISPLALINRGFQVYLDGSAQEFELDPRLRRAARPQYQAAGQGFGPADQCALCRDCQAGRRG